MIREEIHALWLHGKHAAKRFLAGDPREAAAAVSTMVLRLVEMITEPLGPKKVECGFCGWRGRRFRSFLAGAAIRRSAACARCGSLERHRQFLEVFRGLQPTLPPRARVLEVAPTRGFARLCRAEGLRYVSADLHFKAAMVQTDVQRLGFVSGAFDLLVSYHVLDYVQGDEAAVREYVRVLDDEGIAVVQESIREDRDTEEFGGPNKQRLYRIRQYGQDFPDRLAARGFCVRKMGFPGGSPVFLLSKRDGSDPLFREPLPRARLSSRSEGVGGKAKT